MLNNRLINAFRLFGEKEEPDLVIESISKGVVFRGTNLWILIFAIFVASLGLNINSTAVIIGAMLISPIMGPIMGIGLAIGIADVNLLKKSYSNYLFATLVGLVTSTIYFLITPFNEAQSEILARTSPNFYDVFVALFGGLAGIVATSSKQKGNVIPGVAIATALMPPLCTAGYGLANSNPAFLFGALYLYFINTVFIALATLITVRLLKYPVIHNVDASAEKKAKRIIVFVIVLTFLPSVYFGYDMVHRNAFEKNASKFVEQEILFEKTFLLKYQIEPRQEKILLTFVGEPLDSMTYNSLQNKLKNYHLPADALIIKQGFINGLYEESDKSQHSINATIEAKNLHIAFLEKKLDSMQLLQKINQQVFNEIHAQYPQIKSAIIDQSKLLQLEKKSEIIYFLYLTADKQLSKEEQEKLGQWLKVRLQTNQIKLIIDNFTGKNETIKKSTNKPNTKQKKR